MTTDLYEAHGDYTDAIIIAALRQCIARGAIAGEMYQTVDGRMLKFPGIEAAERVIAKFETRGRATEGIPFNRVRLVRR